MINQIAYTCARMFTVYFGPIKNCLREKMSHFVSSSCATCSFYTRQGHSSEVLIFFHYVMIPFDDFKYIRILTDDKIVLSIDISLISI